jgi:hypothetical protein
MGKIEGSSSTNYRQNMKDLLKNQKRKREIIRKRGIKMRKRDLREGKGAFLINKVREERQYFLNS